jgi:hypothetical protein
MKKQLVKLLGAALAITAFSLSGDTVAKTDLQLIKQSLAGVRIAELPAAAADLVKNHSARDANYAAAVVRAALERNPASAPTVVGAVARVAPETAAPIALAAAKQERRMVLSIAKAAAAAAPEEAGAILTELCRAFPQDYHRITIAIAQGAPGADKELLAALERALPAIKPYLVMAARHAAPDATVIQIVQRADPAIRHDANLNNVSVGSFVTSEGEHQVSVVAPPVVGPPFTAPSGTPTELNRTDTILVVPGQGRNYSQP